MAGDGQNMAVPLLELFRRDPNSSNQGLKIVRVENESPATLVFQGTQLALDVDLFDVPEQWSPLKSGDIFYAVPIIAKEGQRFGLVQKLNGAGATGTFQSADGKTITVTGGLITKIEG